VSTDPDGGAISYTWSATNRTGAATGSSTTYSLATSGTSSATATATDGQGGTSTTSNSVTMTFTNRAPSTPSISCAPTSVLTSQNIVCTASGGTDPDGGSVTYDWSVDGSVVFSGVGNSVATITNALPKNISAFVRTRDGQTTALGGEGFSIYVQQGNLNWGNRPPAAPVISGSAQTIVHGGDFTATILSPGDPEGHPVFVVTTVSDQGWNILWEDRRWISGVGPQSFSISTNWFDYTQIFYLGVQAYDNYDTVHVTGNTIALNVVAPPGGVSTGLISWLRADTLVSTSGSNVTSWGGIGVGATSAPGVSMPTYSATGMNNRPAIIFGGANGMRIPGLTLGAHTVFMTFRASGPVGIIWEHGRLVAEGDPGTQLFGSSNATLYVARGGVVSGQNMPENWSTTNVPRVSTVRYTGVGTFGGASLRLNGTLQSLSTYIDRTGNPGASLYTQDLYLGHRNTATVFRMTGAISEVVVYNRALSDAEMLLVERAMAARALIAGVP